MRPLRIGGKSGKVLMEAISIIEELSYKHLGGCCPASYDSDHNDKCWFTIGNCPMDSQECWKDYLEGRVQHA